MICVENNVINIFLDRQPLYFWKVPIISTNKLVHSLKHGVIKSQQHGILPAISKGTKEAGYFKNVFKLMSLLYVYVSHCIYASALHGTMEVKRHQISWNWHGRQLSAAMWMLRIKPRSSRQQPGVLTTKKSFQSIPFIVYCTLEVETQAGESYNLTSKC